MKNNIKLMLMVIFLGILFTPKSQVFAESLNEKERELLNAEGEKLTEVTDKNSEDILKVANDILISLNIKNNGSEKVYLVDGTNSENKTSRYYKVLYNKDSYLSFTKNGDLIDSGTFLYSLPRADKKIRSRSISGNTSSIDLMSMYLNNKNYIQTEKKELL